MDIHNCKMCPRHCGVDRTTSNLGFCNIDYKPHIAEICVHRGEEPVLSGETGVCNVFFSGCNLRCVYCQNYEISQLSVQKKEITSIQKAVDKIANILCSGVEAVGFVSPSHQIFQMKSIIDLLHKRGFYPTIIYNSNGYDDDETLRELEGYVNIYLPDFKYSLEDLGQKYSSASSYREIALKAIKEMYYQKGSVLEIDEKTNRALNGLIIRHLVLPNNVKNSLGVLEDIAYEISPNVHISLMSQYYPEFKAKEMQDLNRILTVEEYQQVCQKAEDLYLFKGWVQNMESNTNYRPDFNKDGNPFE